MATQKVKAISAADKKAKIASLKEALILSQAPVAESAKILKAANQAEIAAKKARQAAFTKHSKIEDAAAKGKAKIASQIEATKALPVLSAKEAKALAPANTALL